MHSNIHHTINATEQTTRRDGHILWYTHFRKLFALIFLMLASVGAWAADYVLTNGTYWVACVNNTAQKVSAFNESTCVWHCVDALSNGNPTTFTTSNSDGNPVYLYQEVGGQRYFLCYESGIKVKLPTESGSFGVTQNRQGRVGIRADQWNYYYLNLGDNWGTSVPFGTNSNGNTANANLYSYSIVLVQPDEGGSISIGSTYPYLENATINLMATPENAYEFAGWAVSTMSGQSVTVTDNSFTMPASDVVVSSLFTEVQVGPSGTYVIYSGGDNGVYLGGSYTTPIGTFNPSTCIWTGSNNGTWQNPSGNYLNYNSTYSENWPRRTYTNTLQISNTGTDARIDNNNNTKLYFYAPTTATRVFGGWQITNGNWYIVYSNNSWQLSTGNSNNEVLYPVEQRTYPESAIPPTISGSDAIATLGTTSYIRTEAVYRQAYLDYLFNGMHHYCLTETSDATSSSPTAETYSYSWSFDPSYAANISVNNQGQVSYNVYFSEDTEVELVLAATSASGNHDYTVRKTITFLAEPTLHSISIDPSIQHGNVQPSVSSAYPGTTVTLTATPEEGYELQSWNVTTTGGSSVEVTDNSFIMPASDVVVSATFSVANYTITVNPSIQNGSVTSSLQTATMGTTVTLTATPNANYMFSAWDVRDASDRQISVTDNQFTMPASNVTVSATFTAIPYNITIDDNIDHGSISSSASTATAGTTVTLSATPDEDYALLSWSVTTSGGSSVEVSNNSFIMPGSDVTISATFYQPVYTVTVNNVEHGSITAEPTSGTRGTQVTLTATPEIEYELVAWNVRDASGNSIAVSNDNKFTMPASNVTVSARFSVKLYTVSIASNIQNGSVTATHASAPSGTSVSLAATPATGYRLTGWSVKDADNASVTVSGNSFIMPSKNVTVSASFSERVTYPEYGTCADGSIQISDLQGLQNMTANGRYCLSDDINASEWTGSGISNFSGTFDGNYHTITGLTHALFNSINDGTVKNVRLSNVIISGGTDVGAIANTATGNSKIYNCGVLSGSVSGSGSVGGLVGKISGNTKVVNNYNYASVSGDQYAAGVVGQRMVSSYSWSDGNNSANSWTQTGTVNIARNTWSSEANNDGSGMYQPFYQIHTGNGTLANNFTIRRTAITGLAAGTYNVSIRVRLYNEGGNRGGAGYPSGCQFYCNGTNYNINWVEGRNGNSYLTYAVVNQEVTVGNNGRIQVGFTVTNNQHISWIAFKDLTIEAGQSMIANCVNYGTEVSGTNTYPVYGGTDLDNKKNPLYDFFLYDGATYRESIASTNGALPAEARFLNRFEYVRATLNAEKKLAAYYLFGTQNKTDQDQIGKWVLDKEIAPYPIIKPWGKYPSLVNPDVSDRTIGTLSVTIRNNGDRTISLPISDQLEEEFDYGYHKVQLPYYNDYFDDNYKANSVVTGWKITSVSGRTAGSFTTSGNNAYNFADRNCTQKDLYSVSGRIFAQGGYYYVPEGVTGITIEPYWADDVVYLCDPNIDKVFGMGYSETNFGPAYQPTFTVPTGAKVQTTLRGAHDALTTSDNVYDHAIVLIGNVNFRWNGAPLNNYDTKAYTIMSIDEDHDNEPDYAEIYGHVDRRPVPPTRLDFVHQVGISWVKKPMGETLQAYSGIPLTRGRFEITETAFARFTEFETGTHVNKGPLIFNAGLIDQFVTNRDSDNPNIDYAILGGHTYFSAYTPGCHPNSTRKTTFWPVSVMGGEYAEFYLTGMKSEVVVEAQNGRVYTNGGKMGTFAGAYWEQLNGDAIIRFDHTWVNEFFGGGINPAKPITGNIDIIINNCDVDFFCAGPKAGNMTQGKTVTTIANNDRFGTYVGAGYGGSSVARFQMHEQVNNIEYINQKTNYFNSFSSNYLKYVNQRGILVRYAVEYMPGSGGMGGSENPTHVTRFYNDYAQLNLAQTYSVTSTLNGCTVKQNFYGGPYSGTVGTSAQPMSVTSSLSNCIVNGNVYGGGKSATIPDIIVYPNDINSLKTPLYNGNFGVYYQEGEDKFPVYPEGEAYTWKQVTTLSNNPSGTDNGKKYLETTVDLNSLGSVFGNTNLTVTNSTVDGYVFGGGDASKVTQYTKVIVDNSEVKKDVFGGGFGAPVGTNTAVWTKGENCFIHGSVLGGGFGGDVSGDTHVQIGEGANGDLYPESHLSGRN